MLMSYSCSLQGGVLTAMKAQVKVSFAKEVFSQLLTKRGAVALHVDSLQ